MVEKICGKGESSVLVSNAMIHHTHTISAELTNLVHNLSPIRLTTTTNSFTVPRHVQFPSTIYYSTKSTVRLCACLPRTAESFWCTCTKFGRSDDYGEVNYMTFSHPRGSGPRGHNTSARDSIKLQNLEIQPIVETGCFIRGRQHPLKIRMRAVMESKSP